MTVAKNTPVLPKVLVIDDETQIRRLLKVILEGAGYEVFDAEDGRQGLAEIAHRRPDVVVLDLGLPDMPGMDVLKRLREWTTVPVLILSVREEPAEKVAALDLGADDYVTKPFEADELLARLRALQRRSHTGEDAPILTFGELEVDLAAHRVRVRGQEVRLTPTEFAVLKVLASNAGRVVTQRQLLREVWGPQAGEQSQYVRVYLTHLRKKLAAADLSDAMIRTEPGIGYRFCVAE